MTNRLFIDVTRLAIPAHRHSGIARIGRELLDWFDCDPTFEVIPVLQEKFLGGDFDVSASVIDSVLDKIRGRVHTCKEVEAGVEVLRPSSPQRGDVFLSTHLPLPSRAITGDAKRAVIVHDLIHHPGLSRERADNPVILQVLDSIDIESDLVVVPSYTTLVDLMSLAGWEGVNSCVVRYGTNFVGQTGGAKRDGVTTILQPGARKNAKAALEAIEEVLSDERFKKHDLTVVATGRMVELSLDFLRQSRLSDGRWAVRSDITDQELIQIYGRSAVFVYPSSFEGFGLPIIEAFACGAPVVATLSASSLEVGGGAVCYSTSPSPQDLGEAISIVLSDDSYRAELSQLGQIRAEQFSWNSAATRLSQALMSM